jgi:hypothetical protein
LSLGWVITEELESCVCSSKWRSWSLYRRSGSERKRRITTTTSRQANGRHVSNDPANERRGKFLSCVPTSSSSSDLPFVRPSCRPTNTQTHRDPHAQTGSLFFCPADAEKRNQESKVRTRIQFSLFSSSPPIISQRETQNTKTTQTPAHVISVVNRQWADASSHRQRQKMDFPSDILVSYNHTRNGLAKSYITPNPSARTRVANGGLQKSIVKMKKANGIRAKFNSDLLGRNLESDWSAVIGLPRRQDGESRVNVMQRVFC